MTKVALFLAALLLLGSTAGCKSNKGAREFIPGRGWVPTR